MDKSVQLVSNSKGSTSDSNTSIEATPINQQLHGQHDKAAATTVSAGRCHRGGRGGAASAVMTDEQIEMLRKQICVYASISERLLELHRIVSSRVPLSYAGIGTGHPCGNLLLPPPAFNKIPSRQRWTPTPMHLEILERLFEECNMTPSRQKIKEITTNLIQHGEISETNVYNWFQNRRARSKRKQPATMADASADRGGIDIASAKEKMDAEDIQPDEDMTSMINNLHFQGPEIGIDQVIGKMESPKRHWQVERHD